MNLSRIFKVRTLREYFDYGGNLRNTVDFLQYCGKDIHWFILEFTRLLVLMFFTIHHQTNDPWLILAFEWSKNFCLLYVLFTVFFSKKKFKKRQVVCTTLFVVISTFTIIFIHILFYNSFANAP